MFREITNSTTVGSPKPRPAPQASQPPGHEAQVLSCLIALDKNGCVTSDTFCDLLSELNFFDDTDGGFARDAVARMVSQLLTHFLDMCDSGARVGVAATRDQFAVFLGTHLPRSCGLMLERLEQAEAMQRRAEECRQLAEARDACWEDISQTQEELHRYERLMEQCRQSLAERRRVGDPLSLVVNDKAEQLRVCQHELEVALEAERDAAEELRAAERLVDVRRSEVEKHDAQRQAGNAELQRVREELQAVDIEERLLRKRLDDIASRRHSLEQRESELQHEWQSCRCAIEDSSAILADAQVLVNERLQCVRVFHDHVADMTGRVRALEAGMETLRKELERDDESLDATVHRLTLLEGDYRRVAEQLRDHQSTLAMIDSKLSTASSQPALLTVGAVRRRSTSSGERSRERGGFDDTSILIDELHRANERRRCQAHVPRSTRTAELSLQSLANGAEV